MEFRAVVENVGDHEIVWYNHPPYERLFQFSVTDSHGDVMPLTRYGYLCRHQRGSVMNYSKLAPGQSLSYTLVASKVIDLTISDVYTATVDVQVDQAKAPDGTYHPLFARSNPVQVVVAD